MKKCRICNTFENLQTRKSRGKIEIWNLCKICYGNSRKKSWRKKSEIEKQKIKNKISKETKKAMQNISKEKRKEMVRKYKESWNKYSQVELELIFKKRGEAISNSSKNKERKKKIGDYWKNVDKKIIEDRYNKYKKTLDNLTDKEKEKRKEKKSKITKKLWKENKEERKKKCKETWDKKSESEKQKINKNKYKKISIGLQIFWKNLSTIEKEEYLKKILIKKRNTAKNKTQDEKEKIYKNRQKGYKKGIQTKKAKGNLKISKIEKYCFEYIKENIDSKVFHQKEYLGWHIDFYLPKYDIFIQFDGEYWHGHLNTIEELKKTKQGLTILETKKRDIKQNKLIKNLIRITDREFKKNKLILYLRLLSKFNLLNNNN